MMMAGNHPRSKSNPTVRVPAWDHHYIEDPTPGTQSHYEQALVALQRFLPSNEDEDFDIPVDAFSCDDFRMFEFKVKKCALPNSHDWTACPFAHPGEKARRRDPRRYHYSGSACPDYRKGACKRGDACEYAHGVFECWLHPARYRTQPCKDGTHCRRRVCFFAHKPEQLRVLPSGSSSASPEASPGRFGQDPFLAMGLFGSSPKSALYSPPSPPVSPSQLAGSMRCLHINKMKMNLGLCGSPPSWGPGIGFHHSARPGYTSLPSTPIRGAGAPRTFSAWGPPCEEEPALEWVESGRELREENSQERADRVDGDALGQDFGWVVELVN